MRFHPEPSEYDPHYQIYLDQLPDLPLLDAMAAQAETLASFPARVTGEKRRQVYAPGKWTVGEGISHLADLERVFGYRALRIGRGDATPLSGFDDQAYVARSGAAEVALEDLVDELVHLRRANLRMFGRMDAATLSRAGTADGKAISVRALACILVGHVEHHLKIFRERYGLAV